MKLIINSPDDMGAAAALGCVVGCLERMRVEGVTHQGTSIVVSSRTHAVLYDMTKHGAHTFRISVNP